MTCPDCKIEMELINRQIDLRGKDSRSFAEEVQIYRCPRCFMEIEVGDEDHELDD